MSTVTEEKKTFQQQVNIYLNKDNMRSKKKVITLKTISIWKSAGANCYPFFTNRQTKILIKQKINFYLKFIIVMFSHILISFLSSETSLTVHD